MTNEQNKQETIKKETLWTKAVRKFFRDKMGVISFSIVCLYAFIALGVACGFWATEWSELNPDVKNEGPSAEFWLGTNILGQDIYQRAVFSTKTAFEVGLVVALVATMLGAIVGCLSGYFSGTWIDEFFLWIIGCIDCIPFYLFVAAVGFAVNTFAVYLNTSLGIEGFEYFAMHIAMIATFWTATARLVRGEVIKIKHLEFVEAAHAIGVPGSKIIFKHILPNTFHILLVQATIAFVSAIKSEVILSYLGLGVKNTVSWGKMIAEATQEVPAGIYSNFFAASAFLFVLVMAFNIFADALQDALDPKKVSQKSRKKMTTPLLSVKDLVIEFNTESGLIRAVDRISFDIFEGETVGLVGESGCGKSITSLSILGLIPSPPGRIGAGSSIKYQDKELVGLPEEQLRLMRGHDISMIFQEPMTALNPVFTVGNQMMEVIMRHKKVNKREALKMAIKMLEDVGIPAPEKRVHSYPHQMSGGMRQRVMIAMALSCNPHLLLADEPTTALDVTIQAQVMDLMGDMQKQQNMAVILVTHDLGVVAEFCQRVIVMYCGHIAEVGTVDQIFNHPQHPYTKGLLASVPRVLDKKVEFLPTIEGTVPDLGNLPAGCRFADRCERATEECNVKPPQLTIDEKTQAGVACYHPYK